MGENLKLLNTLLFTDFEAGLVSIAKFNRLNNLKNIKIDKTNFFSCGKILT